MSDDLSARINQLPQWARDYIHHIETFVGAPEVQELTQLRDERKQLIQAIEELKASQRLEDHVRMFHAQCGGIVVGRLDELICAECGQQMDAFISATQESLLETNAAEATQPLCEAPEKTTDPGASNAPRARGERRDS